MNGAVATAENHKAFSTAVHGACCYCTSLCCSGQRLIVTVLGGEVPGASPADSEAGVSQHDGAITTAGASSSNNAPPGHGAHPLNDFFVKMQKVQSMRWFVVLVTVLHAALAVADHATDIAVAVVYAHEGHTTWATLALISIGLGYIASCISGGGGFGSQRTLLTRHEQLHRYAIDATAALRTALWATGIACSLMCVGLGPLVGVLSVLYGEEGASRMVRLSKLIQGIVESLPQTVLQSYAVARALMTQSGQLEGNHFSSGQMWLLGISLCLSVLSLAVGVVAWRRGKLSLDGELSDDSDDDESQADGHASHKGWSSAPAWLMWVRHVPCAACVHFLAR